MFLLRLITTLIFFGVLFCQSAFCAVNYKVKELVLDNSDCIVVIKGQGNFKLAQDDVYAPLPSANGSINIINDIALHSVTNPARYVIDIPGSVLIGANRTYKIKNSKTLQSVALSQFSTNPHIVRVVFTLKNSSDLEKFKTYTDGENIIVKYSPTVVKNVFQYKFYTPAGDTSARANLQNLSAQIVYNNSQEPQNIEPKFQTKYYLTQISQNSDGLILRGLGQISMERVKYNPEGTMASLNLDSCALSMKYDGKTFKIPSSNPDLKATLTIDKLNSKKVKLTLLGENLRDYRFVVAPDGQSLFISHRTYVINTFFTSRTAKVNSYKFEKNANGYSVFDLAFNMPVTYDVFELNNSFYLDVNNLSDYNEELLKEVLAQAGVEITAYKISSDKTRFIVADKFIFVQITQLAIVFKTIIGIFTDFFNDIFAFVFCPFERGGRNDGVFKRVELIIIVHRRAVSAMRTSNFIAFAFHCEFLTALGAFIAKIFQAVANSAFGVPFNFLFGIPRVFVASKFLVDDIVHFFYGQFFHVVFGKQNGHRGVRFA